MIGPPSQIKKQNFQACVLKWQIKLILPPISYKFINKPEVKYYKSQGGKATYKLPNVG